MLVSAVARALLIFGTMKPSRNAKSVGSDLATVEAQAVALSAIGGRSPVVGRLYHSPRRFSYTIRFQVTPKAQDLEHGCRFEPVA